MTTPALSRSLFALSVFYGGMVCVAGVLGNKQVAMGPLAVEAGIFPFLLLVATSSAIAEVHGSVAAGRLVRFGFVPLIASILLSLFVRALPAAPDMQPEAETAVAYILGATWRIWIAGLIAYGVSQFLNVTLFGLMRREGGRLLWLRGGVASALSQIVDTGLFITIAFWGVFPIGELLLGQVIAKVVLSLVLVPPAIYGMVAIAHRLDREAPSGA